MDYADWKILAMARRFARVYPAADADSDDAAQELRLAYWQAEQHGWDGPLGCYFCFRKMARTHRRKALPPESARELLRQHLGARAPVHPEIIACIRKIRAVVSPSQWSVLWLHVCGYSAGELARQLGMSKATAARRVVEAVAAARAALEA